MAHEIKHLQWDSDFFGMKIGQIVLNSLNNLSVLLTEAQNSGYQLIYVFCIEKLEIDAETLEHFNGKLVDRKLLYEKKIETVKEPLSIVSEYKSNFLTEELEQLAYESGNFSRFKSDNNFKEEDFNNLYKTWVLNSIKHQIADHVFVAKENDQIKGMVTLKINKKDGQIGLMAVSPDAQGKGYGKSLISACEKKLSEIKIPKLEVPTQFNNKQACMFYEKCGFHIKSAINIYHFWL